MGKGEGGMGAECGAGDDGGDLLLGALGDTKWWPPGFRFHPTDEELVLYYLKRKVCRRRIRLPMIGDVDVYKWEPWELPEKSVLRSGDKQWYFFSPRDRKYPNGSRSNRSTESGYWKATGKDRTISQNKSMTVGNKKTLVYYRGRPPRGERTDWVMHEYSLDEQVLMRCNNVQDSYALYKVFRKSGPGPKNGEEYGAPFREEEWNDNEDPDDCLRNQGDTIDLICDHPHSISVAEPMLGNDRSTVPIDDLEDFLLQVSSEQVTTQRHTLGLPDIDVAVEVGSHTLGPPYIDDATSTKQNGAWCDQFSILTSFHAPPHTCVYTQLIAAPDVESPLTNNSEQGHLETSEEFLEIKDFNDPDPTVWSINDISHKDHVPDADEFFDPYDYFDANMYLAEAMAPLDGIMASGAYLHGFDDDETHNQASHMISELWTHEQPLSASAAVELEQVTMAAPASGGVWDSSSLVNLGGGGPQGEISHAGSESDSWFNSALTAFLETIPSSPAMASENALLSRALERVSSFKAGRFGARDHHPDTTTAGGGAVAGRRQGGHNRGLLFLSFLVGLGAALWVLIIGASVKALKCLWGRYSTS